MQFIYLVLKKLTLYHIIPTFKDPRKEAFENIVGKGENARMNEWCFKARRQLGSYWANLHINPLPDNRF